MTHDSTEATRHVRAASLRVPASHPSLPGHFPGAPIVPGVVMLSIVLEVLRDHLGPLRVRRVRHVKFLLPVAPDADFTLDAAVAPDGRLRFTCTGASGVVAEGALEIDRTLRA